MRITRNAGGMLALLALTILIAVATPLRAQERPWTVRGFGILIDGGFSAVAVDEGHATSIESDWGGGLQASLEYRAHPRIGIELSQLLGGVGTTRIGGDGHRHYSTDTNGLGFGVLSLGANFHLVKDERVRLYVGPTIGHVWFSEFDYDDHYSGSSTVRVGNAFAWGGTLGMDIRIAESRWSISLLARYLDTSIEDARTDFGPSIASFDPFVMGVGFGFDF